VKTYEVTQLVEMMITHKVRAKDAAEANDMASERSHRLCNSIAKRFRKVGFGDIQDDYVPARDEDE
jgi:hypothetical protein